MEAIIEIRPTGVHVVCSVCGTTINSITFRSNLSLIVKFVENHYKTAKH